MSYIQSTSTNAGTVTSSTLVFGSNNTAGSTIDVGMRIGALGKTITLSDTNTNTYNKTTEIDDGFGDGSSKGYAQNVAAGANSVTLVIAVGAASIRWTIAEYGALAAASFDKTAQASGNTAAPSSGNTATTSQATETLVGTITCTGNSATPTLTPGSGYTLRENVIVSSQFKIGLEDKDVVVTGTYAADGTLSSSDGWSSIIVTYKGTGGGATPVGSYYYRHVRGV